MITYWVPTWALKAEGGGLGALGKLLEVPRDHPEVQEGREGSKLDSQVAKQRPEELEDLAEVVPELEEFQLSCGRCTNERAGK